MAVVKKILGWGVFFIFTLSIAQQAGAASPPSTTIKIGTAAGGDLAGTYPNPTIRAGLLKFCRIASAQEDNFSESIPLGSNYSVLTLPITTVGDQTIKLDAMMRIGVSTIAATNYRYILNYSIHRDGNFIASALEIREDDNTDAAITDDHRVLHMTWVDTPPEGPHEYELMIQIPIVPPSVDQAFVHGSRSLNALICDE